MENKKKIESFRKVDITLDKEAREEFLRQLEANIGNIAIVGEAGEVLSVRAVSLSKGGDVVLLYTGAWTTPE